MSSIAVKQGDSRNHLAVGVAGFAWIVTPQAAFSMVVADLFDGFSSYSLTVIPLFVFMGQVAFHAGISRRLFKTAYTCIGHLPGGLAMATVGACTGFGAICGSGPATAATQMGVITPPGGPVGMNVYVVSGIGGGIPLQSIFRGSLPFLLMLLLAAVILVFFPGITLLLPGAS